jgi:hypothetical protein
MGKLAVNDLIDQYQRTFRMLSAEIKHFDPQQWGTGLDDFLSPVKLSMHIADSLDYYFSGKTLDEYSWMHHFGGGWWNLPADSLPGSNVLLDYLQELEARIVAELSALDDADLAQKIGTKDCSEGTRLGHYLYALRHTIHHQGELAALSVYHGNEGGCWE